MLVSSVFFLASCSSTKSSTGLKATNGNLAGKWTVSNISVDLPADFQVTNVFDEAPVSDFKGSSWDLIRNGKGSFTLTNGTKEDIYWSINNSGENSQFQFKKLNGQKARNVDEGYRLNIESVSDSSFVAKSPVDIGNGKTGYITYTFSK